MLLEGARYSLIASPSPKLSWIPYLHSRTTRKRRMRSRTPTGGGSGNAAGSCLCRKWSAWQRRRQKGHGVKFESFGCPRRNMRGRRFLKSACTVQQRVNELWNYASTFLRRRHECPSARSDGLNGLVGGRHEARQLSRLSEMVFMSQGSFDKNVKRRSGLTSPRCPNFVSVDSDPCVFHFLSPPN